MRGAGLGDDDQGRDERDGGERSRRDEDGAPPPLLDHRSGDEEAEHPSCAGNAGPHADGFGSFVGREHARDGRQGGGHDQRGADAGEDAPHDERARRVGERGEGVGGAEQRKTGDECSPAAEAVAQRTGEEQQGGEGDGVTVDDPLLVGLGRAERGRHRGQGDVEHRHPGDHERQREADDREDGAVPPRAEVRCFGGGAGR